jgi:TRAP-type transport system small permease protein
MTDNRAGLLVLVDAALVRLIKIALVCCTAVLLAVVTYQVVSRFSTILPIWRATEEISRGLFIWLVALGASLAVRNGEHFSVRLEALSRPRLGPTLFLIRSAAIIAIAAIFIVYGWEFLLSGFRRHSLITGLPAAWAYASLFVAGCLMLFFCVRNIIAGEAQDSGLSNLSTL